LKVLAEYGWCWPSKAKYESVVTDRKQVPQGKNEKNLTEASKEHEIRLV
jgi:hypothetical protein